MEKNNKIVITGKKVSKKEADDIDIIFWANKTWQERLEETERLRRIIWTHILGIYPSKIQKTGAVTKKHLDA